MDPKTLIRSQYHATLDMLEEAIRECPESLWTDTAFDALHYTHLYLCDSLETFVPWSTGSQQDGPDGEPVSSDSKQQPAGKQPYTKEEVLGYLGFCRKHVDKQVPGLDMSAPSGFDWLPMNKLELQFYNIRHTQHHTGQLSERLRNSVDFGLHWVARHAPDPAH
jgi:hypothetical protein